MISALILVFALVLGYKLVAANWSGIQASAAPEVNPVADEKPRQEGEGMNPARAAKVPLPPPEESCDDLRVLVDREHVLPSYYAPDDLVSLRTYGVPTLGGDLPLRREAAGQLSRLVSAAAADGERLVVASAYRSYTEQRVAHARWSGYYGDENAGGLSAFPGQSQHQLGTAVDFTNTEVSYQVWQGFGQTSASRWLEKNAPKYGFVLAYPLGKEAETGYGWEPWHYRYIGRENVERLRESGLSLQKFLEREGVLPRC